VSTTDLEKSPALDLPYDLFAPVYDHFFGPEAAHDTERALDRLLFRDLPPGSSVLDLCCGTGQLSAVLSNLGYQVTGVDNADGMLDRARKRVPTASFILADARDFHIPVSQDAVISAYNSLVHLIAPEDLLHVFQRVRETLKPAGTFVFDLYSESAYRERWRGSFSKVDDRFACIVRASYDPLTRLGENFATAFYESGEWRRADVRLVSRCYTEAELHELLHSAGYRKIEKFDAAADLKIESAAGRVFWCCGIGP
jgi:ubiquinone/menaquinone biosynthesis C-methylase UbiE